MKRLKRFLLDHQKFVIFLLLYVLLRIFLINVNFTEWGDTFRMIRGADFLVDGTWAFDEKRLPLYSILLIPGIVFNNPIMWGRVFGIFISVGTLIVAYLYYMRFFSKGKKDDYGLLAVILVAASPVFAYWSIRVMADSLFAFLILLYFYLFQKAYGKLRLKGNCYQRECLFLSMLLLAITMTRFEGIFAVVGTYLYLLLKRNWKSLVMFSIPLGLIYAPWIVYTKFIYTGTVQNDYINEASGFVFDLERFVYFFSYTAFILVIPAFTYLVLRKLTKRLKLKFSWKSPSIYTPLIVFIFLEFVVGFIWTPSLPRIYVPIIPFLIMFAVKGLDQIKITDIRKFKKRKMYISANLLILALFSYLQYSQKLYFLGASKFVFIVLVLAGLDLIFVPFFPKHFKKVFVTYLIGLSILVSGVVINNQRHIYKTVKQATDLVLELDGKVGYSDETGNTEWYLREIGVYLSQQNFLDVEDLDKQYKYLKQNNIEYIIWTNEFNRGSTYIDPKTDPRFQTIAFYQQAIEDPLDKVLVKVGLEDESDYTVFSTKVYKVL